jgi:hypothetical protein
MGDAPKPDASRAYIKFYSGEVDPRGSNSPILLVKYSLP